MKLKHQSIAEENLNQLKHLFSESRYTGLREARVFQGAWMDSKIVHKEVLTEESLRCYEEAVRKFRSLLSQNSGNCVALIQIYDMLQEVRNYQLKLLPESLPNIMGIIHEVSDAIVVLLKADLVREETNSPFSPEILPR